MGQDVLFAESELGASTLCRVSKETRFDEVFIVSFHSKISSVTVLLSSRE